MLKLFLPKQYVNAISDIDYEKLRAEGYEGLIFDIDNTIVPYNTYYVQDSIVELFKTLSEKKFTVCFLSNNNKKRVTHFSELFNIKGIHMALKPSPWGFIKAVRLLKIPHDKLVIIGDQVLTDVLCGNLQGIHTILVNPMLERSDFINRIKRWFELKLLFWGK